MFKLSIRNGYNPNEKMLPRNTTSSLDDFLEYLIAYVDYDISRGLIFKANPLYLRFSKSEEGKMEGLCGNWLIGTLIPEKGKHTLLYLEIS